MKRNVAAVLLLFLFVLPVPEAFAGRIFGDIKSGGKPLPAGILVRITQPLAPEAKTAAVADTTRTDKFGAYKLNVAAEGKCILTVVVEKQEVETTVFSSKEATRYNLILEKAEDGKLSLRRK